MSRILVVDDDSQSRYLLEILLKGSGYEVSVAGNGAQALESALADAPDLVISDLLMPVMDGFSLCKEWKSHERLRAIPFVVYTATYTDSKDEELALSLGADRFVRKPEEPEAFVRIIADVLCGSRVEAPRTPGDVPREQAVLLKKYSEALFRKLEKKVAELEVKNRSLESTISERARGEKALRASEARYRIVADNTYNWEFWVDPDGAFRYVSPSCKRITGHDSEEFVRDPRLLQRTIHPDDWPKFKAHVDRIEKLRGEGSLEFRILNADGTERWIAHHCLPVFDEHELWLGARGSNRDITDQKRLEAQLLQAQKMEAVGQLAGGIAHDFNNTLTAILGYTALLQMETGKDATPREYLDQIATAVERASSLTHSLLTFSRKHDPTLRVFNLNDLIRNVEKFLQRVIGDDIKIRCALSQEAVGIFADSGQVEQILMNLATNARDAMRTGGVLTIETDTLDLDDEYTHMHGYGMPGRYAMLSVSDSGVGMDEATRQRIFEPFFTTKEAGKGTGLGLSIVYGIVKQHGGYINVYSEPGHGTTFRLLFRSSGAEASSREVKGAVPLESLQRGTETILVVDDDAAVRDMLETYLTSLGYQIILAGDGQDAVSKFREKPGSIDLVVMDTIMPKQSGRDAALEIRALRGDVRVLLMSGYTSDGDRDRGIIPAGIECIPKPLRPSEFAARVRAILDRGKPAG